MHPQYLRTFVQRLTVNTKRSMTKRSLPDDGGSLSSIVVPTSGSFAVIFAGRTDSGEEENSDGEDFRGIATASHAAQNTENKPLPTSSEEDQEEEKEHRRLLDSDSTTISRSTLGGIIDEEVASVSGSSRIRRSAPPPRYPIHRSRRRPTT